MGNLLFAEHPLVVNPTLARIIGLNEAIVLQQIHYWLEINKKTNNNFQDGRYWTYNAIKDWHETNFSFWSIGTVKRIFASLEKMKLLMSSTYNSKNFDRKKWYSIDYAVLASLEMNPTENTPTEAADLCQSNGADCANGSVQDAPMEEGNLRQSNGTDCANALVQNAPMEERNLYQPIAETTTEIKTKTTTGITAENTTTTTTGATPQKTQIPVVRGGAYTYCEKYLGLLSATAIQEIGFFLDHGIQPEVIQLAVDASVDNNVRSWKYTSQILQKCLDNQCLTVAQYQQRDLDFKHTQQRAKIQQPQGNTGGNPFLRMARELEALEALEESQQNGQRG